MNYLNSYDFYLRRVTCLNHLNNRLAYFPSRHSCKSCIDWTVSGWSEPIFLRRDWTTSSINWIASIFNSRLQNIPCKITDTGQRIRMVKSQHPFFRLHNLHTGLRGLLQPALIVVCQSKVTYEGQRERMLKSQHSQTCPYDLHLQHIGLFPPVLIPEYYCRK